MSSSEVPVRAAKRRQGDEQGHVVLINPRIGGLMGDPWWRMHPLSIILKKNKTTAVSDPWAAHSDIKYKFGFIDNNEWLEDSLQHG